MAYAKKETEAINHVEKEAVIWLLNRKEKRYEIRH